MYHSVIRRRIREQGLLHGIMLELTYACNLDCFFCYNDKQAQGKPLALEQYRQLLDDLAAMNVMFVTFTGGEPLLYPRFFELARMARDRGFAIRIKTNGHAVRGATAARLREEINPLLVEMSLHGARAETHDRQTRVPGSFDRLVQNIREMHELDLRPGLVSTPTAWNEKELEAMYELARELHVPLRFQGPVGPRDNGDQTPLEIQPSRDSWTHLLELGKRYQQEPHATAFSAPFEETSDGEDNERAWCGAGSEEIIVDPFGNVFPCLHLRWSAGNLHEQGIREIWRNAQAFPAARNLSAETADQLQDKEPRQLGAPLFCPGLALKGCGGCENS
ncbi:radical SAM/SPASM domain-containing protein [Thiolapillus brandeum]|uniref:Radical SAM domain protein n=1 Tax=Thiolapillus brandeum TaxID=1076588 RepID=A0A7U6JHH7_9GAMM|nr:radical SAM protein [Thiolapillus brandeum]BAO43703.1 radical SAM domain protein [Thiolapillus brandeum]